MFTTVYAGGATSKSVYLRGFTASTGLPVTTVAFNTSGISASYVRAGAAASTITLATQTAGGAYSSGGFVHVAGGLYRLDVPNAAIDAAADYVDIVVSGVSDVVFSGAHIDIVGSDPRAAIVDANVAQISGDSTAADNAEAFFDGTGYAGTNNVIPTVTTTANVTTVNGLAANVITAASIASDAITDAKVASDVTIASVTGAVGSVTGAVGSVTGNVGGNVVGSVGSVAAGGITASSIAADAIGASELAADAVTEIAAGVLAAATSTPIAANVEQINTVPVTGDGVSPKFGV